MWHACIGLRVCLTVRWMRGMRMSVCWHVWMCVDVRRCVYLCNLRYMVVVMCLIELKL